MLKPLTVWITTKLWKFLQEMDTIPYHVTCLLKKLYTGQEATVRTRHGRMDWFKIEKGVCQGRILSSHLFNFMQSCCSVAKLCPTLWDHMNCNTPGFPSLSPRVCSNSCPLSQWCRVHHVKCLAGWIPSWNQDFWEKYQQPQICRWFCSNGRKWRGKWTMWKKWTNS